MSFRLKTILGIAFIEAILLITLITMTLDYLRTTNYDSLLKQGTTTANLFATTTKDAVLSYDIASLEAFVAEVLKNPDIRYARVLGPQGETFASGGNINALNTPFKLDKTVESIDDGILDTFAVINESSVNYGRVELGIDIAPILSVIDEAKERSVIIGAIEMLLVALFSFILGSYLTSQLKELRKAAQKISKGELSVNIPLKGNDEITDVSRTFNIMVNNLQLVSEKRDQAEKELTILNQSLEERVSRRTEQLEKRNVQLINANNEIKDAQAKILQSEKMASLGLLAAGVAHEINNPMSFVISNLDTLKEYQQYYQELLIDYRSLINKDNSNERTVLLAEILKKEKEYDMQFVEEDIEKLISDTYDGSVRVKEIVRDLKEFSHIDHKNEKTMFDINQCIEKTLKVANNKLKHNCEIQCYLGTLPQVNISVGQINQVLLNILVNASQAIKTKGLIIVKSYIRENEVCISIKDNGEGINKKKLSKIFDPFYTTKVVGEGTGLGLSISYGIIADHQGDISVESEVGKGTKMTIKLPIK